MQLHRVLFVRVAKESFAKSLCLDERLQIYSCRFFKHFDGRYLEFIRSIARVSPASVPTTCTLAMSKGKYWVFLHLKNLWLIYSKDFVL